MRLVKSLLAEGFDHVFVFLLRWSPDRAGTSADSGAATLRTWLAKLPASDQAKVTLAVVQNENEGASKMREVLSGAPARRAEVSVCFSQKYSNQTERIQSQWLPIYTKEFPSASPRFLTDETDPGAAAFGTPKFTEALAKYKAAGGAKAGGAAEAAVAELDAWRPEEESKEGWAAYVHGLLNGANGDPFYAPDELASLQEAFFSDSEVLRVIDTLWRTKQIPGKTADFLADKANYGAFWKTHYLPADHAAFKQFCLRQQGVIAPSALAAMPPARPVEAAAALPARSEPYALLAAAAMHSTAERLASVDPSRFTYYVSKWRKFPDGTDNISLGGFDPVDKVSGKDVLFLASFDSNDTTLSQLHALTWLCESAFLSSLTILLAFLPTATMERYLQPGRIPAGNTLAKLLSSLPPTGGKRTRVMIYDVHAPPTQYFFTGSCGMTMHTACPLAIQKIQGMAAENRVDCIAFPDDGAHKRFAKFFQKHLKGCEIVICNKVRTADNKREVVISDGKPDGKHVLIMDDLIQTGGTLYECAAALKKAGALTVSGFVVHGVFPNQSWKRFCRGNDRGSVFDHFWLTSSNPAVLGEIPSDGVFEVLDLAPMIAHDVDGEPSGRAAWS